MSFELIIHNIAFTVSFLVFFSLGLLVFFKRNKGDKVSVLFLWVSLVVCIWQAFYVLGVNVRDPYLSRMLLGLSLLSAQYILITNIHLVILMTSNFKGIQKKIVYVFYTAATLMFVYFIFHLPLLLELSQPKLYLPNFFVAGPFYSVDDSLFFVFFLYLLVQFILCYRSADQRMRNKLNYFILAYLCGYGVSLVPELLLYGYNVDPLPAAWTGLYGIPMAYAILKYDAFNINLLAKRALLYALSIAVVTLGILFVGYANDAVRVYLPGFPDWVFPFISAIVAVLIAVYVWQKIKEVDALKYQFIDVVTHKFRTPMTQIKWSLDALRAPGESEEKTAAVDAIESANAKLYQLTDALSGLSKTDSSQFLYTFTKQDAARFIDGIVSSEKDRMKEKRIMIQNDIKEGMDILVDQGKARFALSMVIENAITYSKPDSVVRVHGETKGDFLMLSVTDTGIGISKGDLGNLFTKFFRGSNASTAHTEGLGIGLYLARDIMIRHGGDLTAESAGSGTGSTFTFKIPLAK